MHMSRLFGSFIFGMLIYFFVSCDTTTSLENIPKEYAELPGTLIARDTLWSGELRLKGQHYVLPGVTLTIEKGTTVKWEYHNNNIEDVGALITLPADRTLFEGGAKSSGRLIANGTAEEPVVFTSSRIQKKPGDWGGIILSGDAPTYREGGTGKVEGLPQEIRYGGNNPLDDSGSMTYVRIEYVGFGLAPGSEINGLSLYAVGNSTILENIQVYKSTDDGFEWFGGTVNAKYLVSMYSDDDSFDMDEGWKGNGQFWLAIQADGADSGFEADGIGVSNRDPQNNSGPSIYNVTLIGRGKTEGNDGNIGMNMRDGFTGSISNTLIYNFGGAPWRMDEATFAKYEQGNLQYQRMLIYQNGPWADNDALLFVDDFLEEDPQFANPGAPEFNYMPKAPTATEGIYPPNNGFFNTEANYIGAFDPGSSLLWFTQGNWIRRSDN